MPRVAHGVALYLVRGSPTLNLVSTLERHKRWANTEDPKVVSLRPVAHYMHPQDLRRALCGAVILGIPSFEPFEVCSSCKLHAAAQDWAPLPPSPAA
jgi:hypothetical protein